MLAAAVEVRYSQDWSTRGGMVGLTADRVLINYTLLRRTLARFRRRLRSTRTAGRAGAPQNHRRNEAHRTGRTTRGALGHLHSSTRILKPAPCGVCRQHPCKWKMQLDPCRWD
ncbi:hypothetical protein SKAU_G00154260 [Synaphobranchus kaupii]|uniref:Uncharacterized protein n=1 Tax=Synaphobranchus kaupii TaxID=118154 RepID=A0A9Q1FHC0_SYNKA|nr:hypothetical protein SKAU_G00154260 [Synaphobranchus kaupii]